ncbi:MAG: class I SAM-dependent methyltransferase [Polynucleobacter sp.]|nr:class I SAM-dependent methyltransferase [Polynucleobacter sp.]
MTIYEKRCCPTCGSRASQREYRSKVEAENLVFEELPEIWNGLFHEKTIFTYARCDRCGLLYCPEYLSNDQLAYLYGQMPENMSEAGNDVIEKTQAEYVNYLSLDSGRVKGAYLEIGPDVGIFISKVIKKYSFSKFWLFEPNIEVMVRLAHSVGGNDYKIIHDMFNFSDVPDNSVDLAVMIQVLDHLLDPKAALKELQKKLKKGGKVFIVTHNEGSFLARLFGLGWPAFCLQHPQIFNKKSMKNLIQESGLMLESINNTKNYFKLDFLLKTLVWIVVKKQINLPNLLRFDVGLRLGNIATIAVKS